MSNHWIKLAVIPGRTRSTGADCIVGIGVIIQRGCDFGIPAVAAELDFNRIIRLDREPRPISYSDVSSPQAYINS